MATATTHGTRVIGSHQDGEGVVAIVLADDHDLVRTGLRMLLETEEGLEVVGEAGDVESAKREVADKRPAVLVLDLNMPGLPTLPAIPEMVEEAPGTAIIVLTMQTDPAFAREAMRVGARGYVAKAAAGDELVEAIRAVTDGGTYINPALGARLAAAPPSPLELLTPREVGVLERIARGHTNPEIAEQLRISVRTVETHRANIQQKLDLSTRAELTNYAIENALLER